MRQTPAISNYEALARRFRRFAEVECRGSSPLYEHLALAIAADEALLALAAHAPQGPVPNLFLANGQAHQRLLAYCDPHGQWLEWLEDPPPSL
jgi:hypothetical protein